jgi:hypothetical protein
MPSAVSQYVSGFCNSNDGGNQTVSDELVQDDFVSMPDPNVKAFLVSTFCETFCDIV